MNIPYLPISGKSELKHTSTWLALYGGFTYHTLVENQSGNEFLKSRLRNGSDVDRTYESLHNVGKRSDFPTITRLEAKGGIYTDTDTIAPQPIDSWIPARLRHSTRLVAGIEFDQHDSMPPENIPHPFQFAQWTIASALGHPVLRMMIACVHVSVEDRERQHGLDETELRPTNFEVLNSTGPAA
ncbi:hypothetical protein LZ30DRAFT_788767 [Colletotrichum cereale]|nr:hypothetical protein LZ30DRAFT_788767 [Colletotrichum cereale]